MIINIDEFTIPIPNYLHEEEISMGVRKGVKEVKVRLQQNTAGSEKVHGFNAKVYFANQKPSDVIEIAFNRNDLTFNSSVQEFLNTGKKTKDIYKFYLNNEEYLRGAIYYARELIIDRYINNDYNINPKDISNKMKEYSKLSKEEQKRYQDECDGN